VCDRTNLVVVAQSLGGFTAPLVCDRAVQLLVLVAPVIPAPGEAPAGYWKRFGPPTFVSELPGRDLLARA
jgi:hypothetical protein